LIQKNNSWHVKKLQLQDYFRLIKLENDPVINNSVKSSLRLCTSVRDKDPASVSVPFALNSQLKVGQLSFSQQDISTTQRGII
jgi:hypothetical protein